MKLKTVFFAVACLASINAQASVITNGDFDNDFSGWNKYSIDGSFNTVAGGSEFQIDNGRASVGIDPFALGSILSQDIDFNGDIGSIFTLSFDIEVETNFDDSSGDWSDILTVGLSDGSPGYYDAAGDASPLFSYEITENFSQSFSFDLANSYTNTSGWSLDFQLDAWNFFGSTLFIDNVSLVEIPAQVEEVPEPSTLAVFALGLLGLVTRKKHLKL
ncbi:MAG: PEP-CTERM sorting domain-containing protein [Thalassotalea sp.]